MSISSTPFSKCFMLLSIILLSHSTIGQSNAMNTSIQSDPHFIGWYMRPSTSIKRPATSGNYARGCSKGACGYATDCIGNSITYDDGKTSSCNVCRTMTIFQSAPDASPSASNIFCAENWVAFTVFRVCPHTTAKRRIYKLTASPESATISASSRTSVLSTTAPSTTGSFTNIPPTTAAPTATQAGDLQPVTGSQSSQRQGWIAGAVIGSVAATAIIAGLIGWFVYLRKKAQRLSVKEESIARQSLPYRQSTHKAPQEIYTASNRSNPFVHELSSYSYR
ncbi:hypothetical protein N7465_000463 [Penicillium sp. CMV-2018d]|nr:hypothetical protein N7465_000463 [Penicillium sp. CMV-2018d]